MAYYNDEDDLENQDPNSVGASGAPMTSQPGGVITGTGAQQPAPAAKPDQSGSNFVGLKTYLDANRAQGSKLGDRVAGQVSGKINEAQGQVAQLPQAFEQEAMTGALRNLDTAGTEAKGIVSQASQGKAPVSQDQTNRFREISNAEYRGPKTLAESKAYQPAQQSIQAAQQYADLSKDESGSQSLLRDLYGKPSYNTGENRLDAYLLNSKDNREKLANARSNAAALNDSLQAAGASASQVAQRYTDQTEQAKAGAKSELESQRAARSKQIDDLLAGIQKKWSADNTSEYSQYLKLLNDAGVRGDLALTPEQMKKLSVKDKQRIFNVLNGKNAKQFLTMQAYDANKIISKEDQAALDALDGLAREYGGTQTNKYTMDDLAGTLSLNNALDASRFGESAARANAAFDKRFDERENINPRHRERDVTFEVLKDAGIGGILTASPREIEAKYLPKLKKLDKKSELVHESGAYEFFKDLVADIKKSAGYGNQVKKKA